MWQVGPEHSTEVGVQAGMGWQTLEVTWERRQI